ncbi:hypothetical protein GE061_016438 [Apolygus lucorum]|uniref:Uncharacterized protein n=1 Tax=Apolygus lucorum TaxID=248454 RepID=A0A6A4K5I9_APOLU|nr:hypothetical protein GE061_016438 [Apolygus lucorum]
MMVQIRLGWSLPLAIKRKERASNIIRQSICNAEFQTSNRETPYFFAVGQNMEYSFYGAIVFSVAVASSSFMLLFHILVENGMVE